MLRRKLNGTFYTISKELKEQDSDRFKGYVRMDVDHFEELDHLLSQFLQKHRSVNLIRKRKKCFRKSTQGTRTRGFSQVFSLAT